MPQAETLLPGSTIGMLGGGQLGRMSLLAGRALGYRFHVFDPQPGCAACSVADQHTTASWDDLSALDAFARSVDRVTLEFENIPAQALETLAEAGAPPCPNAHVLKVCQHRATEKAFLRDHHFPHAPFALIQSPEELAEAVEALGTPCVLKTAAFGYDGKGQLKLEEPPKAPEAIWQELGAQPLVAEAWISFQLECSVVVARSLHGQSKAFPMAENLHRNHILHQSIVPARVPPEVAAQGERLARELAETLGVVGLLAVELFLTAEGQLLVNEMAPRPHNSGHYTIEGCATSQFAQHIRAVCGLPLGEPRLRQPCVMTNLLGDLWPSHGLPPWPALLREPDLHLHLYDKGAARPGRKMGHFTLCGPDRDALVCRSNELWEQLRP